jgi:hypothetical protein
MTLTMYQAAVPTFVRALDSLAAILEKAAVYAETRKIDPAALLGTRLFPDMLPLVKQVHIANDAARSGAARLAGAPVPTVEGKEASFPDLVALTRSTIGYLESFQPAQFVGSEDRTITWQSRSSTKSMQGTPYLFHHVLPNVYFHVTTAYDILRHTGLEIGKQDFLGRA